MPVWICWQLSILPMARIKVSVLTLATGWSTEKFADIKLEIETNLSSVQLSETERRMSADFALKI